VRRYWMIVVGLMAALLIVFAVVEALEIDVLVDPSPWLATASLAAAVTGVALLIVDVVLPVPSSLVMIALGSLFGLWVGASLSLVGLVGAGIVGFGLGRRGERALGRFIGPDDRARADRLVGRWGPVAIALTRAIPILAETTVIVAGMSRVRWLAMLVAVIIGSIPVVIAFAAIGATANRAIG
jgi:uncharacterized membrane protein YdjX (TVP38/TMEM64 family)